MKPVKINGFEFASRKHGGEEESNGDWLRLRLRL